MRRVSIIAALAVVSPASASLLWYDPREVVVTPLSVPGVRVSGGAAPAELPLADPLSLPAQGAGVLLPRLMPSADSPDDSARHVSAPAALFKITWGTLAGGSSAGRSDRFRFARLTQGHAPIILVPAATATVIVAAALLAAGRRR